MLNFRKGYFSEMKLFQQKNAMFCFENHVLFLIAYLIKLLEVRQISSVLFLLTCLSYL